MLKRSSESSKRSWFHKVCTINHYLLDAVIGKLLKDPVTFSKNIFSAGLLYAHLQYICNMSDVLKRSNESSNQVGRSSACWFQRRIFLKGFNYHIWAMLHGGNLSHKQYHSSILLRFHMKCGFDWPSRFRDVWKVSMTDGQHNLPVL